MDKFVLLSRHVCSVILWPHFESKIQLDPKKLIDLGENVLTNST